MTAPVIGVTLSGHRRDGRPDLVAQNRSYLSALERAGAVPLPIPPLADLDRLRLLHDRCDGLCLPGGPDVAPQRYGETPAEDLDVCVDPELDALEMVLAAWALAEDRPVLAICRGAQLLNVSRGGRLWQDLRGQGATTLLHRPDGGERFDLTHGMAVEPGSRLHRILGDGHVEVNSLHHQGIRELGDGLVAAGRSGDGLVEAVEMPEHRYVVGVQSHPEELCGRPGWATRLFGSFVAAAAS